MDLNSCLGYPFFVLLKDELHFFTSFSYPWSEGFSRRGICPLSLPTSAGPIYALEASKYVSPTSLLALSFARLLKKDLVYHDKWIAILSFLFLYASLSSSASFREEVLSCLFFFAGVFSTP